MSGHYDVGYSNVQHDCQFFTTDLLPESLEIVQAGTELTLYSSVGDGTGWIDPMSGAFEISLTSYIPQCPFGCVNTTRGTFQLGLDPLAFDGNGQIDVINQFGGFLCTATYDIQAARTECSVRQISCT